jgi:predicted component of type VI protein secretion system
MSTRDISLHIERLVVEGLPGLDGEALERSLRRELQRLLNERGLSETAASRACVDAGTIDSRDARSERIGAQVARAAHAAIGGSR